MPANAHLIRFTLPDGTVKPDPDRARAVYFYERDSGVLLLHHASDRQMLAARGRELVVGFLVTIGNYDYFFNWVFRLDGSFGFESELQGLILHKAVHLDTRVVCRVRAEGGPGKTYVPEGEERFGTLVAPGVLGVHHQHWINLRLDFDFFEKSPAIRYSEVTILPEEKAEKKEPAP